MNKQSWWLIGSMLVIHLLMYITFIDNNIFWYLYSGTALVMIALSITSSERDEQLPMQLHLLKGIGSGVLMYGLFFIGYTSTEWLPGEVNQTISNLFYQLKPENLWQLAVLILIIIPAEEIFWRGFIQRKLHQYFSSTISIFITAVLSGSVFYFSGEWIWMAAAFVGALYWGILYAWKRSLPMLILSHLTFDLLFFYFVFI